jgi:cell division cycle 20-like protein 1 (cofactor of APC complex)
LLGTPDRSVYTTKSLQAPSSFVSSFGSIATPTGTPSRYISQYQNGNHVGRSDRFIPSRATSNFNFSLWGDERETGPNVAVALNDTNEATADDRNGTATEDGVDTSTRNEFTGVSQQALLNELLRSELLGENTDPTGSFSASRVSGQQSADNSRNPLREAGNYLRFQSPRQLHLSSIYHQSTGPEAIVNSFSLTPMGSAASHRLLSTPQKRTRRIQKVPFKVLDAPALQDDFYLNLVDW